MLSPSKTSLTMSEDCEEMLRCEKTEESLALERKVKAFSFYDVRKEELLRFGKTAESLGKLPFRLFYRSMKYRTNRWYVSPVASYSNGRYKNEHERQLEKFCLSSENPLVEQSCQAVVNENELEYEQQRELEKFCLSYEDPLVEQSCQAVVKENGHKFNMTEGEYNSWKDMPEELKDVLIQIIPEKAEFVRRLRSEARGGMAKAASPASQKLKTEGRSSTGNYARESSDLESGSSSTQAGDVPAERRNLEAEGGSSVAQNEPLPNHQGLPCGCDHIFGGGDHQVHKPQVNMRSKLPEEKAKAGSPDLPPSQDLQDTVSKVNLWTSLAFISAPIFLNREYYKDRNSDSYKLFDAFMICIILSFTGAFCALLIRNKPKLAVLRGCYLLLSIVSMASALSILGYALFWKV